MLILTSYPELENDRWTVETLFVFNINFYNQISFKKFVDSNIISPSENEFLILKNRPPSVK